MSTLRLLVHIGEVINSDKLNTLHFLSVEFMVCNSLYFEKIHPIGNLSIGS